MTRTHEAPPGLRGEAQRQRSQRIAALEAEIRKQHNASLLEPYVTLVFEPAHAQWARLCAAFNLDSTATRVIELTPWPSKQEWAWKLYYAPCGAYAASESYVSFETVYAAFEEPASSETD